jgi:hypothetical protein
MPWQRLSRSNGQTLQAGSGRERELAGANFFCSIGRKPLIRKSKILSKRFGPAQGDAMTRWKWRRKLLERLIVRHR